MLTGTAEFLAGTLQRQRRWHDSRSTIHESRLISSLDWAKLLAIDPLDIHTRLEFSRCLADEGRYREALIQLAMCQELAADFKLSMRDRLMIVSTAARIRQRGWRRGALLSR